MGQHRVLRDTTISTRDFPVVSTPRSIVHTPLCVRVCLALATALAAVSIVAIPAKGVAQDSAAASIREAVAAGDSVRVAALLDADPTLIQSRDPTGRTLLRDAAAKGDAAMVRLLLARGAEVDARDNTGRTPLIWATGWGNDPETAKLLLDAGADVNAETPPIGESVLLSTMTFGSTEMVDLLLDRGARLPASLLLLGRMIYLAVYNGLARPFDLAVAEAQRRNLAWARIAGLHQAAWGGSVAIGKRLLEAGADVNAAEVHGSTPLQIAAENGHLAFVEWLVENGASLDAATPSGMRAVDFARAAGHEDVANRLVALGASSAPRVFPELRGPYMGQPEPTDGPAMFAPGIVSLNLYYAEHSPVVVSPDGKEMFWGMPYRQPIMHSKIVDGRWTAPEPAPFNSSYSDGEAIFSPDGQRVYFLSTRPLAPGGATDTEHVWYVEREGDGWSEPHQDSPAVNAFKHHWLISVSRSGTLYFSSAAAGGLGDGDIYRAPMVDGVHQTPENLGPVINTPETEATPFIAPDESYLIFSSRGRTDDGRFHFYISYRGADGAWLSPQVLDSVTGSIVDPVCPAVTPDGQFMFFIGNGDIWWVKADFIDAMRPDDHPAHAGTQGARAP
jgi:ankyrin repeat protein